MSSASSGGGGGGRGGGAVHHQPHAGGGGGHGGGGGGGGDGRHRRPHPNAIPPGADDPRYQVGGMDGVGWRRAAVANGTTFAHYWFWEWGEWKSL